MTHSSMRICERIEWDDCQIIRHSSNNGVVLKRPVTAGTDVVAFIDGADIGVTQDDMSEVPVERAKPIFRMLVKLHNRSVQAAFDAGYRTAQRNVREVIGLRS